MIKILRAQIFIQILYIRLINSLASLPEELFDKAFSKAVLDF